MLKPADVLVRYASLFEHRPAAGPILDLACGEGHNGIFLALRNLPVICCDRSQEQLDRARELASEHGVTLITWKVDLERPQVNPLPENSYGGVLVFRYLHRPLIPCIRKSIQPGGLLIYETYTADQPRFGSPRNPDYLLKPGELAGWFADWNLLHWFEGIQESPARAVAQLVCRKPRSETH